MTSPTKSVFTHHWLVDLFFQWSETKIERGSVFQVYAINVTDAKDERGSVFQGYVINVTDAKKVMLAYMQMKKCYPRLLIKYGCTKK